MTTIDHINNIMTHDICFYIYFQYSVSHSEFRISCVYITYQLVVFMLAAKICPNQMGSSALATTHPWLSRCILALRATRTATRHASDRFGRCFFSSFGFGSKGGTYKGSTGVAKVGAVLVTYGFLKPKRGKIVGKDFKLTWNKGWDPWKHRNSIVFEVIN